jgi:hypothetical protein
MGWQAALTEVDRIRAHTDRDIRERLDRELRDHVEQLSGASPAQISQRLEELDTTWDVERLLMANAAILATAGVLVGGLWKRKALAFPAIVGLFLLQHAVQGWCPPLAVFRRFGARTRKEIDLERYTLKALRGDFEKAGAEGHPDVDAVLDEAARH